MADDILLYDSFLNEPELSYLQEYSQGNALLWEQQISTNQGWGTNSLALPFLYGRVHEHNQFIYGTIFNKISEQIKGYFIDRVYFNGQRFGMDGCFHTDHCDKTILIYVSEYNREWGGFTQIGADIIAPKTNRMIAFDGNIPHKAFAYSRQDCPMRITLAYKLNKCQ